MNTKVTSIFSLLLASVLLAVAFIPTRYLGAQGIGVFSEICIRYFTPALIIAIFFSKHIRTCTTQAIFQSMISGFFLWIALVFAIYGIRIIEYASMGLLLVTLYVLIVPLIIAYKERRIPSLRLILCALVSFFGLTLLIIGKPLGTPNLGTLLCFISSIFYALYLIVSSTILDTKLSPITLHFYQSITLAFLSIPCMFYIEEFSILTVLQRSTNPILILISLGFIGIFIGFITYQCLFYGQRYLAPSLVVIILSTKNVFGAILEVTIYNLPITGIQYIAYGLVIASTTIASLSSTGMKEHN